MNEELLEREKRAWDEVGAVRAIRMEIIRKAVQEKFPQWPVAVRGAADDASAYCVDVFNVPDGVDRKRVEEFIFALDDDKDVVGDNMLLAMVHSVEVTKQYYPQFADKKGDDPCLPQK